MTDEQQDQTDQRDADRQDQHDDDTHATDLGDKGKAALQREREARKAAEKARADLEKRIAEFETAQKARDDADAKAKGEWEKVATEREKELETLRAQIAERDLADLRRTIAKKHNLADDALEFVAGADEDAIEASVKKLVKLAARNEDVDTDSGKRTATGARKQSDSLLASYKFGARQ